VNLREAAFVAALVLAGFITFVLPPPGLLAAALGLACLLLPVRGRVASRLEALGGSARARTVAGFVGLAIAVPANLALGGQLDGHLVVHSDFHTYLVGAQVGLEHGWSQLFDVDLQRTTWAQSYGGDARFLPFLNTPPQAWLVAPLVALPYVWAYGTWVALMVGVTAIVLYLVAPSRPGARLAVVLLAGAAWVVTYSLASGQNAIIGALAIALCWRLRAARRPGLAGVALALIAVRPNANFLVPLALLLAGERRVFLAWLATSTVVGAVVLVSLGTHGVQQFMSLGVEVRRDFPKAIEMTLQQVLGAGPVTVALQLLLAGVAMFAAARLGRGRPALAICAGVVGSAFLTPYIHVQDYLTFLAAIGLVITSGERRHAGWVLVALLVVAPPGWLFGDRWPPALIAVELAWLAWLTWPALGGPGDRLAADRQGHLEYPYWAAGAPPPP
jgi:hypothetical protein